MTQNHKIIRPKLGVLKPAKQLGNVSQQISHLWVLGVGDRHVLTHRIHSWLEDVVLDVLVDLQFGSESAHQVPLLRVMG